MPVNMSGGCAFFSCISGFRSISRTRSSARARRDMLSVGLVRFGAAAGGRGFATALAAAAAPADERATTAIDPVDKMLLGKSSRRCASGEHGTETAVSLEFGEGSEQAATQTGRLAGLTITGTKAKARGRRPGVCSGTAQCSSG